MRGIISKFNAIEGCSDSNSCLKAEGHSNEESNNTCAQEPNPRNPSLTKGEKDTSRELSDRSASTFREASDQNSTCKRRRSPHSSRDPKNPKPRKTKGDSEKTPTQEQGSRSKVSNPNLRMFVLSKLELYKGRDGKYNGIVRILADVGFLQYCYMLIKGKPGNMSPGITKETLDGLTYE